MTNGPTNEQTFGHASKNIYFVIKRYNMSICFHYHNSANRIIININIFNKSSQVISPNRGLSEVDGRGDQC